MRRLPRTLRLVHLEERCTPTGVSWDGGGGDFQWTNALNWSNNKLPGPDDAVTITGAGSPVQLLTAPATVASLTLDSNLVVQNNALSVTGTFTLNPGKMLTVSLAGGSFSADGASVIDGGGLLATQTGSISLPGVTSISTAANAAIEAQTGASISLPSVTAVTGSSFLRFRALTGGSVSIPAVSQFSSGSIELRADGSGSKLDASALASFTMPLGSSSSITAINGGVIQAPNLTTIDRVLVTLDAAAAMPVAQISSFNRGSINCIGGTITFTSLSDLETSSVLVSGGANVDLPGIVSLAPSASGDPYFQADGAGSKLSLSHLSSAIGSTLYTQRFRALNGGIVSLPELAKLETGKSQILGLKGGVIQAPLLTELANTRLEIDAAASFPAGQIESFKSGTIVATGGTITFAALANFDSSSINASGGANVALPSVVTLPGATGVEPLFQASSTGTVLSLPNLNAIQASSNGVHFWALKGGIVSAPSISKLENGPFEVYSDGPGSLIDMSLLNNFTVSSPGYGYVTVGNGGEFKTAAALNFDDVDFALDDTAKLNFSSVTIGANAILEGSGTITANATNAGTVHPQGILTINGNYTQLASGQLAFNLAGTTQGTQYDSLKVIGQATLDGLLQVGLTGSYLPSIGNSYQIMTFASRSGQFWNYNGLGSSVELQPNYLAAALNLNGVVSQGPILTVLTPSASTTTINSVDVTFNETINGSSFGIGDVGVTGPAGPYAATSISQLSPTQFRIFLTPLASVGDYTITVGPHVTDAAGNNMDQDADGIAGEIPDDVFAGSISVGIPELSVTAISGVPAAGNFGQSLALSWTVLNSGTGATEAGWINRIWLSADAVLDGSDLLLGDKSGPAIKAGTSYDASMTVALPTTPAQPDGTYFIIVQADALNVVPEGNETDNAKASTSINLSNPPRVESVAVNNGAVQRSRVNALTVTFSEAVNLPVPPEQAFSLTRTTGAGSPAAVGLSTSTSVGPHGETIVQISFLSGSEYVNASLVDGSYTLKVLGNMVNDGVLNLDGNRDGTTGDDYSFTFFRKFGDGDGNNLVNQADYIAFRNAFNGGPSAAFDYDNDGNVTQSDYIAFRNRFNT